MSLNVGVANPGTISGVSVANPGRVTGVGVAQPGVISSVGNANSIPLHVAGPTPNATTLYSTGGGGGYSAPAPVYAPRLDVAGTWANARASATGTENALYSTYLNQFLSEQGALRTQHQQQADMDIKNLQDALKQTQDANALTGTRTTADTATKEAQIATNQDQNQIDSGTQFEDARLQAARSQAAAGTLGTGAGNRETGVQTTARNTTEGRQNDAFQQSKDQQELFKNRTFEDLAKSNELATSKEASGETQTKFDLSNYIQNLSNAEIDKRNQLNEDRQKAIAAEAQNQAQLAYRHYLGGISNPAQYQAALSTYGGQF